MKLYTDDDKYTEEAKEISRRFREMTEQFMEEYVAKGYNTRELAWFLQDDVKLTEIWLRNKIKMGR